MIGARIKEQRQRNHFTQKMLADKVSTSSQVISNWERGYTEPSADDIKRLAKALDCSSDFLLGRESFTTQFREYRERRNYLKKKQEEYQLVDTEYAELEKLNFFFENDSDGFDVEQMRELDQLHILNQKYYSKNEKDIAKRLEAFKEEIQNSDGLAFDGEPMSEEAKESLLESMELLFRQTQRINKKYTPKKYREDE